MATPENRKLPQHDPAAAPQAGKPHSQPQGGISAMMPAAEEALSAASPAKRSTGIAKPVPRCPRPLQLDARLRAAADWVTPCEVCADIGCDHGRLGATLLLENRCGHLLAADVSAKALAKARECMRSQGLSARVTFTVADGLAALDVLPNGRADVICILGMGGETLAGILNRGYNRLQGAKLVLGAQTELPLVRETLCGIEYQLTAERVVEADGRLYLLMTAEPSCEGMPALTERELLLGPCLLHTMPADWFPWLLRRQRLLTQAITAMRRSASDAPRLPGLEREMRYTQDALAELNAQYAHRTGEEEIR